MKNTKSQIAFNLLKDVPEPNFITGNFTDNISKCCSIGHLARLTSNQPDDYVTSPANDLNDWCRFSQLAEKITEDKSNLALVNDGMSTDKRFQQETPKARVMALLTEMINQGM